MKNINKVGLINNWIIFNLGSKKLRTRTELKMKPKQSKTK